MLLTREQLLQKEPLQIVKVPLGGEDYVFVRQMSGRERDTFERSLLREETDRKGRTTYKQAIEDFRAKLATRVVCDEKGVLIFKPEDVSVLSQNMSAGKLELIINVAQEINKISEEDVEAIVKNSLETQSGGGSTESGGASDPEPGTPTTGSIQ